nr:hypothetical protein CFP56_63787 [Quercus suber]
MWSSIVHSLAAPQSRSADLVDEVKQMGIWSVAVVSGTKNHKATEVVDRRRTVAAIQTFAVVVSPSLDLLTCKVEGGWKDTLSHAERWVDMTVDGPKSAQPRKD